MKADRHMVLLYGLIILASASAVAETRPGNLKNGQRLYQRTVSVATARRWMEKERAGRAVTCGPLTFTNTCPVSR